MVGNINFFVYLCFMNFIPVIPTLDELYLKQFSSPRHPEWLILLNYSLFKYIFMKDSELAQMEILRKAGRCATLYELLCESLGLEPLSPNTHWRDVAKSYSITMEDAMNLQQPTNDETAKD